MYPAGSAEDGQRKSIDIKIKIFQMFTGSLLLEDILFTR